LTLWIGGRRAIPQSKSIQPNSDLSPEVRTDFLEAASIVQASPRGAAALLRLCIQKICVELEKDPKDLNNAIAQLVAAGLSPRVSKMLDIVRVTGNEAVHPGQMDLKDDEETVSLLFELVNLIADELITRPKELERAWMKIPEDKRKGVETRKPKA
jgi:hypothetical protein